ncbi:MAG: hypothetical protein WAL16_02760 [Streptosporangiaceae bacterium]
MSSDDPGEYQAESNGQLMPQRVAELAGELSEARDETRRRRIARQIPQLASRSGQATVRGLQSGTGTLARRARPARDAAARGVQSGRGIATRGAQASGNAAWRTLRASGQWLTAQVLEMAPRVPIRSLATLQAQFPGRSTDELAQSLIVSASRASAGVGAAVGASAAVPFVPTVPIELGVETLALVAIELKLIAELHEVYGMPAPGSATQRMIAYTGSWAERRGVRITTNGLALAVGSPLRRKLERRLLAKASQSALSLAPLLTGAAAGALIDHYETRRLGLQIRDDLRKRARN